MSGGGLPTGVVTFLLTDVEGSTALWDRRPDVMGRALQLHDALIDAAVTDAGGRVLKARGEGDSTFAVFDRPTAAIRAALAARRALQSADWPEGCRLEVRFAVHSGEVEERAGDYYGNAVNRAARIRGLAVGGQVLVSQAVAEMVADNLPRDALLVEVGEHELRGLSRPERICALVDAARPVPEAIGGFCPYKGLLAFQPEDDGIFFGREATVALLLGRLLERRLIVVVGASGSGKSSAVRAGVLAAVRRGDIPGSNDWPTLIMTPGDHPCARLDAFDPATDGRTVIAVDQMEEMFTACSDPAERADFVTRLLSASRHDGGRTLVIGAMRADFFGHCASVPGFAAALSDATVLLGPMEEADLRRAIEAPAEIAGLRLEPGLVDVILRDLGREPGSLPLLSHALLETWRRREGSSMTLAGYQESGGVRGAIAHTAEGVWNEELTEADRPVARRIFLRLTELGEGTEDTRRRVRRAELVTGDSATETDRVLGVLADRRLVTVDDDTVEVAHEALIREWPRLRGWLDDDREGLRIHRHLTHTADEWDALGRPDSELYRGPRLAATRDWLARDEQAQLNVLEDAFVEASKERERAEEAEEAERVAARERATRRLRRLLVATAIALVVALGAGFVAFTQRSRANRNARHAHAATFSAEVDRAVADVPTLLGSDRSLAALLAVQARRLRPDAASNGALLAVLRSEPRLRFTLTGGLPTYAWLAAFPDRQRVVAVGRGGADVWNVKTRAKVGTLRGTDTAGVAVSPDGSRIAIGDASGSVTFWDGATLAPAGRPLHVGAPVTSVAFTADGRSIAVAVGVVEGKGPISAQTSTRVWDVVSGAPKAVLTGHTATVNAVVLSHDGKLFATGGNDDLVVLHDAATGRPIGLPVTVPGGIYSLAFSENDRQLAIGMYAASLPLGAVVLDVQTRTLSRPVGASVAAAVAFVPGGRELAVGSSTGFDLFDTRTVAPAGVIAPHHGPSQAVSVPGIGLVVTGFDGTITVWDLGAEPLIAQSLRGAPRAGGYYSPDGRRLLIVANDNTGVLYALPGMQRVARLAIGTPAPSPLQTAMAAAFKPDGKLLAIGNGRGQVQFFDASSGASIGSPIPVDSSPQPGIVELEFSPNGKRLVATSLLDVGNGAHVIDVATRRVLALDPAIPLALTASFRPDGRKLVVTSGAGAGLVYDIDADRIGRAHELQGPSKVETAGYSPDGRLLVVGYQDGSITFLDAGTRRPIGAPLPLSPTLVADMRFSPDSRMLMVEDYEANNFLVDVASHARIGEPFVGSPSHQYGSPAFSPDGRTLVLPSPRATQIWDLVPADWEAPACALAGRSLTREEWNKYFANAGAYRPTCT